jgi:hypothetical protein
MFKNVKVGDVVATITSTNLVRLVRVEHVTRKAVHIRSANYAGSTDRYSREDGSRIGKCALSTLSLTTIDDPRVVRRLANIFYNDALASLLGSYTTATGKDLEADGLVARINDIKSYLDETSSVIQDVSKLVGRYI